MQGEQMETDIAELIAFCQNMEQNHAIDCKRYDDASGYTRSGDESIRTTAAKKAETYSSYYRQVAGIITKFNQIEQIYLSYQNHHIGDIEFSKKVREILKYGNVN